MASLVLNEGFFLGLLGGLAGIPLAKVLLITAPLVDVGGYAASGLVSSVLPPGVVLEGLLVSVLAGGIGSLIPLIRVLRLQPAEVLRSL